MNIRKNKGITLIALVITIVILIILAGVSINIVMGDGGIFNKVKDVAKKTEIDNIKEKIEIDIVESKISAFEQERNITQNEIETILNKYGTIKKEETTGKIISITTEKGYEIRYEELHIEVPEEVITIPEGLKIGSEVTYSPSGTYNWEAKYCTSTKTEFKDDVLLNSDTGADFNIIKWKVLSINETTGKVELVPSTQTKGNVYLGQAQGYNNGVKLLNDACSSLYGNTSKGIEARSINIEDIEKVMDYDPISYKYYIQYGEKWTTAYSSYRDSIGAYIRYKNYPVIYSQEANRTINEITTTSGLSLSSQSRFIERNEGTSTSSNIGLITNATSIYPIQTYYYLDSSDFTSKLGDYASIILPKGNSTTYWVASRCVNLYTNLCDYRVRVVLSGSLNANIMDNSSGNPDILYRALFPVISLKSNMIEGDSTNGFVVK